jgi:leucine dehydrogenase
VGEKLARRLAPAGAELLVSDIDESKRSIAAELDAQWLDAREAMLAECDLLAPCALGGAIDSGNASRLSCAIVCGSANNQLAEDGLDQVLAARDILYAPDFIVNAGGLIHVYKEIRGYSEDETRELVLGIEANVARVLWAASERSITPLRAACELARERLARATEGSPSTISSAAEASPRPAAA